MSRQWRLKSKKANVVNIMFRKELKANYEVLLDSALKTQNPIIVYEAVKSCFKDGFGELLTKLIMREVSHEAQEVVREFYISG